LQTNKHSVPELLLELQQIQPTPQHESILTKLFEYPNIRELHQVISFLSWAFNMLFTGLGRIYEPTFFGKTYGWFFYGTNQPVGAGMLVCPGNPYLLPDPLLWPSG